MSEIELNFRLLKKLESDWQKEIESDEKYWRENEAKLRAVTTAQTYQEFSDIVKASHLHPISGKELSQMSAKSYKNLCYVAPRCREHAQEIIEKKITADIVPRTPAEFSQVWKKLDNSGKMKLLESMPVAELKEYLKVECPPNLLCDMIQLMEMPSTDAECDWQLQILELLTTAERFSLNLLFLSEKENYILKQLFKNLKNRNYKEKAEEICLQYNILDCDGNLTK